MPNDAQSEPENNERAEQDCKPEEQAPTVGSSVEASAQPPVEINPGEASNNTSTDENERKRQKLLERVAVWQAIFSVMLVIFTAAQAWFGGCQWIATEKQYDTMTDQIEVATAANETAAKAVKAAEDANNIAREIAQKQLRAAVFVDEATFSTSMGSSIGALELTIKNYGQTPAYNVVTFIDFAYLNPPFTSTEPKGWRVVAFPRGKIVLGPGATKVHHTETTIVPSEMERLKNRALQLQIHGGISYEDIFGRHYTGSFRMQWGGHVGTKDIVFDMEGNDEINWEQKWKEIEAELESEAAREESSNPTGSLPIPPRAADSDD